MSDTNNAGDEREPRSGPPLIPLSTTRPSRRRAIAAMAVTGALGLGVIGFVGGRWSSSSTRSTRAAVQSPATGVAGPAEAGATAPPRTAPVAGGTAPNATGAAAAPPMTAVAVPALAPLGAPTDAKSAAGGGSAGSYSNGAYEEPAGTLVGARTTPAGIALTGYLQTWPAATEDPWGGQFPGWTAPAWCTPTGSLRISIVTANAVGLAGMSWFSEPHGTLSVTSFAAGYLESHPVFGLAAQVDGSTTGLTLTTADGRTDTAAGVGGLVLLAVDGPIAQDFTVTATHADGNTTTLSSADLAAPMASVEDQHACQPPAPALPPAGAQPADAVAADAGVRAALATYTRFGSPDPVDPSTYVDDTTGVAEAIAALRQVGVPQPVDSGSGSASVSTRGSASSTPPDAGTDSKVGGVVSVGGVVGPGSIGPIRVSISELVFVSPTEAWFRYDLISGFSTFIDRYGQARLVDGTWKLTRQTLCQDIALAGVGCSPAVDPLVPPSAKDDPRYGNAPRPEPAIAVAPVATTTG